ncbi:MAG: D-alanine--D-alanine ligase [Rhodothalassiaceae bacterium]
MSRDWPMAAHMPALDRAADRLSFFEFWPGPCFYAPVPLFLAWLSVRYRGLRHPLAANPCLRHSGLVGESKLETLALLKAHVDADLLLPHVDLDIAADSPEEQSAAALGALQREALDYPLVAKPDIGCRGAGVRVVCSTEDLQAYLAGFPAPGRLVLQQLADFRSEAGVYYVRPPGADRGHIFSLTLKYFPHVVGDGRRSLRTLIHAHPRSAALAHLYLPRFAGRLDQVVPAGEAVRLGFVGSHSKGAIFRDGGDYVTAAMTARFDAIARSLPDFHIGRFDIRFEDFAAVQQGRGFKIVELNGAGAEATHIWDSRTPLRRAWATLYRQWRWLYRIGAANRRAGARPAAAKQVWHAWAGERALAKRYPPAQ